MAAAAISLRAKWRLTGFMRYCSYVLTAITILIRMLIVILITRMITITIVIVTIAIIVATITIILYNI